MLGEGEGGVMGRRDRSWRNHASGPGRGALQDTVPGPRRDDSPIRARDQTAEHYAAEGRQLVQSIVKRALISLNDTYLRTVTNVVPCSNSGVDLASSMTSNLDASRRTLSNAMAREIMRFLGDEELRAELEQRAIARSRRFTWELAADQAMESLLKAASHRKRRSANSSRPSRPAR